MELDCGLVFLQEACVKLYGNDVDGGEFPLYFSTECWSTMVYMYSDITTYLDVCVEHDFPILLCIFPWD